MTPRTPLRTVARLLSVAAVAAFPLLTSARALAGTFYSQGSLEANATASWNSVRAGSGSAPADFVSGDTLVVQDTHALTLSADWTVSGAGAAVVIETGGSLTVSTGRTFTAECLVTNGGTLGVDGTLRFGPGGSFDVGSAAAPTYATGSTLEYANTGGVNVGGEWTGAGAAGTGVPDDVTVTGGGSVTLPAADRGLAGSLDVSSGTFALNATSGALEVRGDWTVGAGGAFTPNGRTVLFTGAADQTLASGGDAFAGLTVNKAGGEIVLSGDLTVDGVLTFTAGNIETGASIVVLGAVGSVSRTSGHVVGRFRKPVAAGGSSRTFQVGDATNYAPVQVTGQGGGFDAAFDLTVSTAPGDHDSLGTSGLAPGRSVNRTWTLTPSGYAGGNFYVILNFTAADVDAGAAPARFVVRRYSGGAWTTTSTAARTSTSTRANGLSAFGEFSVGEQAIDYYQVAATSPQLAGAAFTTTVTAYDLLNAVVVDDSSTQVTMTSSGAAEFDADGNGTYGDSVKTLTSGAFGIATRDATPETVTLIATDANAKTGSRTGLVIQSPLTITTASLPRGMVGSAYSQSIAATGGTGPYTWAVTSGVLPAGLALDDTTGQLSGTPTTAETQAFTVQVTDALSATDSQAFSITVDSTLAITTTTLPNGTVGAAYSQGLAATGGTPPYGAWTVTVGALPSGLALNDTTGVISGTPTTAETQAFTVQVADSLGRTATQALSITVDAALAITTTTLPNGTVGSAYSQALAATGGTPPYGAWTVTVGTLPSGLALNDTTGVVSGTPTTAETQAFTVQVADSLGRTATQALSITVDAALAITTTTLPNGTVDSAYSQALAATGGTPPYGAWTVTVGTLPSGLALNDTTGVVSGTPTTAETQAFTVQVADSLGRTATQALSITVDAALAITTSSLPNGTVGSAYSQALAATGGTPPYGAWTVTAGALPAGLALDDTTGIISGTPTTAETQAFTVQVADSLGRTATQALSITVDAALAITTTTLPNGTVGAAYSQALAATGGTPPYGAWTVTVGTLPAGLALDDTTGVISGTPTTAETQAFTVQVADSLGRTATQALSITADAALAITTTTLPNGTVGAAYSQALAATGGTPPYGAWTVTVGTLPAGLALDDTTGVISGTPTTAETQAFTVQVSDSLGRTASQALSITVDAALAITTTTLPNGTVGTAYSQALAATGGTPPYGSWILTVGTLPSGLALNDTTGVISGTPTTAETQAFTVQVSDSLGRTATQALSIAVDPALAITTTTLPNGTVGSAYSQALAATGGTPPYGAWTVTAGTLPAGLALNDTTGVISGTPTTAETQAFTVQVSDSLGRTTTQALSIAVDPALAITTTTLPNGTVGTAYSQALAATGGTPPYGAWTVTAGTLPAGLALDDTTGVISGTPTTAETQAFTVQVSDSLGRTASQALSITIDAALAITTTTLPNGMVGAAYSQGLAATGGTPPYGSWILTVGTLPSGLALNDTTGVISGTPTTAETQAFTVQVSDSLGSLATQALSITVDAALAITTTTLPNGTVGAAYSQALAATGGTPPYGAWTVTVGTLPAGLSLDDTTGVISGTPTTAETQAFTLQVGDSLGRTATQALSITVDAALVITTTTLPNGTVGSAYSQALAASGGTPPYGSWAVTAGALPSGLALNDTTGIISGTPTTAEAQAFTVQVADSLGSLATQALSITVDAALAITTSSLPNGMVGSAYSQALDATGGTPPYGSWTVTTGALPSGLALDDTTGVISGTPTTAETQAFTVQVSDSLGRTATQALSIAVDPALAITTTTLPNGTVGAAYSQALAATGGTPPYGAWTVTVGTLPAGLSLDDTTGVIAGTPTTAETQAFTVQASDSLGRTATQALSITVDAALAITTTTLPNGAVGAAYSQALAASGGTPPYGAWTVTAGALPSGLALNDTTGVISGTPTTAETQAFTVQVSDSLGSLATQALSITIDPALTVASTTLPNGMVGSAYSQALAATGGTPPYGSWILTAGALPSGLALNDTTGVISGTPTTAETQAFTVQVSDSLGRAASQALSITVDSTLAVVTATLPGATAGTAYLQALAATGGAPPYGSWILTAGALPSGLALNDTTGVISGTPTTAETQAFTVQVGDSLGRTASQALSLTVSAGAAARVAVAQGPDTTVAGSVLSPHLSVQLRDAFGNAVADSGVTVDVALTSGAGTLAGTTSRATGASGLAVFDDLVLELAGAARRLTVTSAGLAPDSSALFDVLPAAADSLAFVQQPTAVLVGAAIAPAVTVRVLDAYGNAVPGEAVTLALVGTGTLGGGGPVATDSTGLATFASLTVSAAGAGKSLEATAGPLGPVASDPFDVTCPAIAVAPATLQDATQGSAYAQLFTASGGTAPYSFAVTAGALPAGLSLAPTGELTGAPADTGAFFFSVTATDAFACTGERACTLRVVSSCPAIAVLPSSLPAGSVAVPYAQAFSASAGAAPFTFAVTAGALPGGLSLSAGGGLTGTPAAAGSFTFTVGVTDSNLCTGSREYTLEVLALPAAIADLAAVRQTSGNDADGTAKITLTFTPPPGADTVEVYRAGFGGYPRYDNAGGAAPAAPSYPPGAPWTLTAVTAGGQADEPATRDFWYYVAFSKNAAGGVSAVSNLSNGALDYHLGDVSDGFTVGQGNNLVGSEDVSLLGANYGISEPQLTIRDVHFLDVGPTTDLLLTSRPFTDGRVDFEDFIVFATNFFTVSGPALASAPAGGEGAPAADELSVQAPAAAEAGATVTATLRLAGTGLVQGFSAALAWDASVVEPLAVAAADWIGAQGGMVLTPGPGVVDAALLGVRGSGLAGEGDVATVTFRVLRSGAPAIRLAKVTARDPRNRPVELGTKDIATGAPRSWTTALSAPWPNPARGQATLEFTLARAARVDFAVYSVDGRRVKTLAAGGREAGEWRLSWDGTDDEGRAAAPGLYYARLVADGARFTRRLVLLR